MTDHSLMPDPARRPTSRSRRHALAVGVSTLAVAGVAAGIVAGVLVTSHPARDRHDEAAGGTHTAAAVARVTSDPDPVTYVHSEAGDVWIPADQSGVWELSRPDLPDGSQRANCAAFPFFRESGTLNDPAGHVPGCDEGSWDWYRPAFAQSLPDDPDAVLASMREHSYQHSDINTFVTGDFFIANGWADARTVDLVAAALKEIPGVETTHDAATGTETMSRTGQAKPGVTETWSITVDPATHRVVASGTDLGSKTIDTDNVTYKKVAELGATS